jgi:hypothetical protein
MGDGLAGSGVDPLGPPSQGLVDESLADPSVAAGDQNCLAFDRHYRCLLGWSVVGRWRMVCIHLYNWPSREKSSRTGEKFRGTA